MAAFHPIFTTKGRLLYRETERKWTEAAQG
jgi:hypothetical protein